MQRVFSFECFENPASRGAELPLRRSASTAEDRVYVQRCIGLDLKATVVICAGLCFDVTVCKPEAYRAFLA